MNGRGWLYLIAWSVALLCFALWVHAARAHDHNRPELNGWYKSLKSKVGPCCDGPSVDAVHLADVDWETQNKPGSQYRARIPSSSGDMELARRGEKYNSEWVDVPDDAVIAEPNRSGSTLVWPMYGYLGKSVRCFMPGSMT